jgi:hypothetical protein
MPPFVITKQQSALNFKSKSLSFLSFGNQGLVSSYMWIATMIESDTDHYKKKDTNSWLYHRFNTITDLNPYFYNAYKWGGLYLSVVKDDDLGAKDIYLKGLAKFPKDYELNYYYGFHAYLELNDQVDALKYFERVLLDPKGMDRYRLYLPSLVAKLRYQKGEKADSIFLLEQMRDRYADDPILRKRFEQLIQEIQMEKKLK